jgi:hypothetical protein
MNQIDAVTPAPPSRSGTTKPRDTSTSPSLLSLSTPMLIAGAARYRRRGGGALVLLRRESWVALAMPQVVAGAATRIRYHQPTPPRAPRRGGVLPRRRASPHQRRVDSPGAPIDAFIATPLLILAAASRAIHGP